MALGVTAAGVAAIALAVHARWNAGDLDPGLEGLLTTGLVGFLMLILHPFPYAHALALSAPIVAAEYVGFRRAGGPAVGAGLSGVHLCIMGFAGLLLTRRPASPP